MEHTTTESVKEAINTIINVMQRNGRPGTRELSLAVTNLEQARMWITEYEAKTGATFV